MELNVHDLLAIFLKVAYSLGSIVADITLFGGLQRILIVLNLALTACQRQTLCEVANVGETRQALSGTDCLQHACHGQQCQ